MHLVQGLEAGLYLHEVRGCLDHCVGRDLEQRRPLRHRLNPIPGERIWSHLEAVENTK